MPSSAAIPVLINREGGSAAAAGTALRETLADAFRAAGLTADIQLLEAGALDDAVRASADRALVIVGGGDGTIGVAAGALLGTDTALGILPLGTRNHLARQLGIPADIPGAVQTIANGKERAIDVATVNGFVFVNNASVGFYPSMVRSRDEKRRHGLPTWLANIFAGQAILRRLKHHRLRVEIDGAPQTLRTPLLFVGNNVYSLEGGHVGQRRALDGGVLSLFAVATGTRLATLWFGLRTMVGGADLDRDFAVAKSGRRITVAAHASRIHVALDGEVRRLETPLRFEIKPRMLHVIAPG